jgi:phosphoserine aminotransferase
MSNAKPQAKPQNANYSSGPTAKRPGWSVEALKGAPIGRSHRSKIGKAKLEEAINLMRETLQVPADYKIGIVPASDTGAVEMAMWSMLGARPVDVAAWESFGGEWVTDITKELKLADCRTFKAGYGELPKLNEIDTKERDVVFTWNGTTSGVKVPNGDWIAADRKGITINDATSAVYAMEMPWDKLDVTTFSWQKVLGSEAAHGILILSPRAVARLESYTPDRPLPKIFRLTKGGKLIDGIFKGETINTPSMLAVEDAIDALKWVKNLGGLKATIARSEANLKTLEDWVAKTDWVDFLCADKATRSNTSICLKITADWYVSQPAEQQAALAKELTKTLDAEGVAYDIDAYRDAPAGIRIWGGATVEASDLKILTEWLDYAFAELAAKQQKAAA